jgi:hypothetical protein
MGGQMQNVRAVQIKKFTLAGLLSGERFGLQASIPEL